jgi:hypothetical protein
MKKPAASAHAPQVGAPDPELKTSPIFDDGDDLLSLDRELEESVCYFNNAHYAHGQHVTSGDELLYCQHGVWLRKSEGSH